MKLYNDLFFSSNKENFYYHLDVNLHKLLLKSVLHTFFLWYIMYYVFIHSFKRPQWRRKNHCYSITLNNIDGNENVRILGNYVSYVMRLNIQPSMYFLMRPNIFSERKLTEHTPNKGMINKIEMRLKEKRYETIFVRNMASKRKLIAPEKSELLR